MIKLLDSFRRLIKLLDFLSLWEIKWKVLEKGDTVIVLSENFSQNHINHGKRIKSKQRPALPFELGCMSNKMEQPWNASCKVCTEHFCFNMRALSKS